MTSFVGFQFRRGLSNLWTSMGTILAPGEPGVELDSGRFKIGDGSSSWNKLPYFSPLSLVYSSNESLEIQGLTEIGSLIPGRVYLITGTISFVGNGNSVLIQLGTPIYQDTPSSSVIFTFSRTLVASGPLTLKTSCPIKLTSLQIVQLS